ncbi:MAG: hypothetical protein E7069_08535 [Bacteroidales bacterium]|jgi:hypothetical protein|nr:hypothetical protein [Bacteroidales bacterium]
MNRILLLLIVITLNTAYAWAKWAPTWSSGERWSHVLYHDNSTNCESNLSNFPKFMDSTEDPKGNGFSYYITESKNSKANPGSFDVVYVITDAITLREGVKYTLQFDAKTYNEEEDDAKLSIGLLTDADPTATTISQTICEFEKYTPGGNDYKTETVEFTSQVSGTYYLRLNLAFTLKKQPMLQISATS